MRKDDAAQEEYEYSISECVWIVVRMNDFHWPNESNDGRGDFSVIKIDVNNGGWWVVYF